MSLGYFLGRTDTHVLFDLGPAHELASAWYGLSSAGDDELVMIELLPHEPLAAYLREHLPFPDADARYYDELARRLVAFAGGRPVALLSEDDDLDDFGDNTTLRIVDSRYQSEWTIA
jgi:hypothetical protein